MARSVPSAEREFPPDHEAAPSVTACARTRCVSADRSHARLRRHPQLRSKTTMHTPSHERAGEPSMMMGRPERDSPAWARPARKSAFPFRTTPLHSTRTGTAPTREPGTEESKRQKAQGTRQNETHTIGVHTRVIQRLTARLDLRLRAACPASCCSAGFASASCWRTDWPPPAPGRQETDRDPLMSVFHSLVTRVVRNQTPGRTEKLRGQSQVSTTPIARHQVTDSDEDPAQPNVRV